MLILYGLDFSEIPAPEAICFGCTVSHILETLSYSSSKATQVAMIYIELNLIVDLRLLEDHSTLVGETRTVEEVRGGVWDRLDHLIDGLDPVEELFFGL
jgi:hypothetical protein